MMFTENQNQEDYPTKFQITQIAAAIVCSLATLNCGLALGWLSPAFPQMKAEGGVLALLDDELASTMEAWIAGAFPLTALIFSPLAAFISEFLGRKTCNMIGGIPFAINSLIILLTDDVYLILCGRFIMGAGTGIVNVNFQIFIGEMADPAIRGRLGSFMILFYTIGITTVYLVGGFFSYKAAGGCMLFFAVCSILFFVFIPETPAWLVKNGKIEKALHSISWYRRKHVKDPMVIKELEYLQKAAKIESPSRLQAAKLLIYSKPLRRGFLLCILMIFLMGYMGMVAVHSYSVTIFLESGAGSLTAEGASAVYGSIQIMGSVSSTTLVDRLGRKVLMSSSCLSVSICMLSTGLYFHLQSLDIDLSPVQWLPVVLLSICVYTYTIGAGNIPFILMADFLTNEVRSIANMLVMLVFHANMFIILLYFGRAIEALGPHPIFYFFGIVAGVSFILTVILLPETKGKTTEEVQMMLSK